MRGEFGFARGLTALALFVLGCGSGLDEVFDTESLTNDQTAPDTDTGESPAGAGGELSTPSSGGTGGVGSATEGASGGPGSVGGDGGAPGSTGGTEPGAGGAEPGGSGGQETSGGAGGEPGGAGGAEPGGSGGQGPSGGVGGEPSTMPCPTAPPIARDVVPVSRMVVQTTKLPILTDLRAHLPGYESSQLQAGVQGEAPSWLKTRVELASGVRLEQSAEATPEDTVESATVEAAIFRISDGCHVLRVVIDLDVY